MRNKFLPFVVLFFSCLNFQTALAGAEGHGGGAFVCRDASGKIKSDPLSVEVLDLWEGNVFFKLPIKRSSQPWLEQVNEKIDKLRLWQPQLFQYIYPSVASNIEKKPDGAIISPPQDVRSHLSKKNCPLEGAASYNDQNDTVYIDPEITEAMNPSDFSALIVHEMVYKALREMSGDVNSVRARRITGFLFSDLPIPQYGAGVPTESLYCQSSNKFFSFYLFKEQGQVFAQFENVAGQPVMAVTRGQVGGRLPTSEIDKLLSGEIKSLNIIDKSVRNSPGHNITSFKAASNFESFQFVIWKDSNPPSPHNNFTCNRR